MHIEFEFLRKFFRNNGYPIYLINVHIRRLLNNLLDSSTSNLANTPQDSSTNFYFTIPYFGAQSQKLQVELQKVFRKYFSNTHFHIIPVNGFSVGSFFNYKDVLPKDSRTSIVYKYSCERCSSVYVGSTSRRLHVRVCEHMGLSSRTEKPLSTPAASSIRDHAQSCNSPISLNNFNIIGTCKNVTDLRILESLHIHKLKPPLNSTVSAYPLSIIV